MKTLSDNRRRQLLACAHAISSLAEQREIKPVHVSKVSTDLEIRRVLETVVRRWPKLVPATLSSPEAVDVDDHQVDLDHVVPCRALDDRMIMNPDDCELLLTHGVVLARITKKQHKALGGILVHHEALHGTLLHAPIRNLEMLGRQRYDVTGVTLRALP